MSIERPVGTGPSVDPGSPVREAAEPPTPAAIRLQILSTEHWSLLASRSLAWNESFSRAGMFLTTLSGAIVALALVAQATDFGEGFVMSANDDARGIGVTMALPPGGGSMLHVLAATPSVIGVVNSVLAAAIIALVAVQLAATAVVILVAGVVAFVASMAPHAAYGRSQVVRGQVSLRPLFPSQPTAPPE